MTENTNGATDRKAAQEGASLPSRWICSQAEAVRSGRQVWLDLPDEVRELLIGLMTRLMLDHVAGRPMLPAKVIGGGDEH